MIIDSAPASLALEAVFCAVGRGSSLSGSVIAVDALEELSKDGFPDDVDDADTDNRRNEDAVLEGSESGTSRVVESEYFRIDVADPLGDIGDLGPAGVENEPRGENSVGNEPLPDENEGPEEDDEPRDDDTDPLGERELMVLEDTDSVSVCISSAYKL